MRPFAAVETERLVEVMAATFAEYGMRFDPDGFDRDVREAARRYAPPMAAFFTALADGRPLGFAGVDRPRAGTAEIHRVYIDPAARGLGLGRRLCDAVEAWAQTQAGVHTIELWSDVRFTHAHAMYAARGYVLMGQRILGDPDRSVEWGFRREAHARVSPAPPEILPVVARSIAEMTSDADFAHRCGMVAAALLDPRALVRAGRVAGGGHVLPGPEECFGGAVPSGSQEISALVWDVDAGAPPPAQPERVRRNRRFLLARSRGAGSRHAASRSGEAPPAPDPGEADVFSGSERSAPREGGVEGLRRGAVLGFERGDERRLHPAIHDVTDASWPWGCPGGACP